MMSNVALISSNFPQRQATDRGLFIQHTARALAARVSLKVFCPVASYPDWRYFQPRRYLYATPDVSYAPAGTDTEYFVYRAFPLISRPVNYVSIYRGLMPRLRKLRPDLLLAYGIYPEGLAVTLAARDLGIPAVLGSRGSDLHSIPGPVVRTLTRRALRLASKILTVSEDLHSRAIAMGVRPERVHTIRNGCDTGIFHPRSRAAARSALGIQPDARMVLFAGRFQPVKGLADLLDAFARLASSFPKLQLVLAGDGRLRPEIQVRAERCGLRDRVHFPGVCPPGRIAEWMAAADVFCLPSHSEGCPNVVIEALSCGRPVVATNAGGIPELVNEANAILVPPRDPATLSRALKAALERTWDEAAIAWHSVRSWDDVAAETLEVCRAAVSEHASKSTAIR